MRIKERLKKKLLVEGNDDQHVIWAFCEKLNIPETFEVIDCEGIDNLIVQIPIRFKQSGLATLGIVIDADNNIQKRWTSLKNLLIEQGFAVPNELPSTGLKLTNDSGVNVGVWIMPNNTVNGMLEDFIRFLVPENDALLPIVNSTLNHIESENLNKYLLAHRTKATIHSWLSWQEDPGTPMGLAITKRFLTTDEETCKQFVSWLTNLFI